MEGAGSRVSSIFSDSVVFAAIEGAGSGVSSIFSDSVVFAAMEGDGSGVSSIFLAAGTLAILVCGASRVGSEFSFSFEFVGDDSGFLDSRFLLFFESLSTLAVWFKLSFSISSISFGSLVGMLVSV